MPAGARECGNLRARTESLGREPWAGRGQGGTAMVLEACERKKQRSDPKLSGRWRETQNCDLKEPMPRAKGPCC